MSPHHHTVTFAESQQHVINATNPSSALDDGVEDGLHIGGRAAYDAEHLGCCRLMLQCLTQLCIPFLQLLKQPDILDGNDGLVREGFEKGDLLVCEGTDLRAANHNRPNRNTLTEQQGDEYSVSA